MNEAESKRLATTKILTYLEHVKQHALEEIREGYRQGVSNEEIKGMQAAVRLLASRQRRVQREFTALYAPQEIDQVAAAIELHIDKDDGSVFIVNEWTHGKGRIDCSACYTEQTDTGIKRFIRVCDHCSLGFQHCNCLMWDKDTQKPITYTGLTVEEANRYKEQNSYCLSYHCEHCGTQIVMPYDSNLGT